MDTPPRRGRRSGRQDAAKRIVGSADAHLGSAIGMAGLSQGEMA